MRTPSAPLLVLAACAAQEQAPRAGAATPVSATATVTQIAGVSCTDHRALVAWSPDGASLAAWLGGELVLSDASGARKGAVPLAEAPTALAFAGPQHLAVLSVGALGGTLRRFKMPDLAEEPAIPIGTPAPSTLVARADAPWVALAPVAPRLWSGAPSGNNGAVVYDVSTGTAVGGGGPLYSAADAATLSFSGQDLRGVALGSLRSWRVADRAEAAKQTLPQGSGVCQVVDGASGPVLGRSGPASVGAPGEEPRTLGDTSSALFQLQGAGGRVIAVVVHAEGGRPVRAEAVDVVSGARWPLPWPLTGVALSPDGGTLAALASGELTRVNLGG